MPANSRSSRAASRTALTLILLWGAAWPATAGSCRAIEGLDAVLGRGKVLLLGELHGTVEAPAFTAAVACRALEAGLPVTVGLELPRTGQEVASAFVGSGGGEAELAKILALPFWARRNQDGRTSRAMLDLMEALRAMKGSGGDVEVLLIDQPKQGRGRDAAMADRIRESVTAAPDRFRVILTGNLHGVVSPGSGRMGALLVESLEPDRVTALKMSHTGGEAWICEASAGCGPLALGGRGEGEGWRVTVDPATAPVGYQGVFQVGSISASPPARGGAGKERGGP